MEKKSALQTKRYPGVASIPQPNLSRRLMAVVYVWFILSVMLMSLVSSVGDFIVLLVIIICVTTPLAWGAVTLYEKYDYSRRLRKWRAEHYTYTIRGDWPILELLKKVIERLQRRGYFVISTREDRVPEALKVRYERFLGGYHIMPGNRRIFVLVTMTIVNKRNMEKAPAFSIIILPIAKPFNEDEDPVVDIVGGVLWDHEVDLMRQGLPSTIPPELF
jgi:hypothetical protein